MLHQLQVGQVGHWEFLGGHLDHSKEMQTYCPHDCHSIDGHEVCIGTYTVVCPYPWFNQELQDISSMIVAIIICHCTGILFFSCLDNFQSDHYSRKPTGSTAIFWFPVNRNVHWQDMVDPMAALPTTPGHGLVDTNLIPWEKFALGVH